MAMLQYGEQGDKTFVMGKPGRRSVEDASRLLKRFYQIERACLRTIGGFLVNVGDWEMKKRLPQIIWQDSLRAGALRARVLEMRYPKRDVDQGFDSGLSSFLALLIRCKDDAELIAGVFLVVKRKLLASYQSYLEAADPTEDAPTVAFMSGFASQLRGQLDEAEAWMEALPGASASENWSRGLEAMLAAIGGLEGADGSSVLTESAAEAIAAAGLGENASPAIRPAYEPPLRPRRPDHFGEALYHMPPVEPAKFIERQLWQGINHVNEIWASEITGLVLWKWDDMPWEFYLDCSRWCYDEARHCQMGEERMKAWGFRAGIDYPVVGDHYAFASGQGELAVLALLHAFETGGPGLKAELKERFEALGDTGSAADFDYDWADESIHLHYGYKWVLHRMDGDADGMEEWREDLLDGWWAWVAERHAEWDYEPFISRLRGRIAEIEAEGVA
jgi:hypothetical protein